MSEIIRSKQGIGAIAEMFEQTKSEDRSAFLPFFTVGYPDYETSLEVIEGMARAGADGFEIGIPFSDPLADGPTNQAASQIALENGTTVETAFEAIKTLRTRGLSQPMLIFTYINPVLAYGADQFVLDAKAAGADGFIIPDLPPEEAHLLGKCVEADMALVFFLAPTSNEARIKLVSETATGFIYVVSVTGITGARTDLPANIRQFIARVKSQTDQPLVLGFGISTPEHAQQVNHLVDGFIVGSALIKAAREHAQPAVDLAQSLRKALD